MSILEVASVCQPEPILNGEVDYQAKTDCCELPTAGASHIQTATYLTGEITIGAEVKCRVPLNPLEDLPLGWRHGEPGIEVSAEFSGKLTASVGLSGRLPDSAQLPGTPGCADCTKELTVGVGLSFEAKLEAELGKLSVNCKAVADAIHVHGSEKLCPGAPPAKLEGCFGPVEGSCAVELFGFEIEVKAEIFGKKCWDITLK